MKKKIKTSLLILFLLIFSRENYAQEIVPNGQITSANNWTITGNGLSLNYDGTLVIVANSPNDEPFILNSASFSLFANEVYSFNLSYGHFEFDPIIGEQPLIGLTSAVLKNASGTIVNTFALSCQLISNAPCNPISFSVPSTGVYYIELRGEMDGSGLIYGRFEFEKISITKTSFSHSILGNITYDINTDNCVSSTYKPSNILVKSLDSGSGFSYYSNTNINGDYIFAFNAIGSIVTEIASIDITSIPINYTNNFTPNVIQNRPNQDFCITSNIAGVDVGVVIIPLSDARPGFNSKYEIIYTNHTNTTLNAGDLSLSYSSTKLNYLTSNPVENSSTINSCTWNYTNLLPLESRSIIVDFNINTPPTVNNGQNLPFTVTITPTMGDFNLFNNTFTLNQRTIGSYDPNDITILQGQQISTTQATDYLYFRIRFQNTGTASAINIKVKTLLDTHLDWATFVPLNASHTYSTSVINNNEIYFNFDNINLSDSTTDEPNSHGYILFKVKPNASFTIGDIIYSNADIFFDYNLPIYTNIASTQISTTASANSVIKSDIKIYPNPVLDVLYLQNISKKNYYYRITDTNGQIIYSEKRIQFDKIEVNSLKTGIYFIEIIDSEFNKQNLKFIKI